MPPQADRDPLDPPGADAAGSRATPHAEPPPPDRPAPETRPGRAVLDTNVLVGAAFRPRSASGRLADAVRHGRLVAVWCPATRAEAERLFRQIPPLRAADLGPLFPEAGRLDAALDPDAFDRAEGAVDRTLAALAHAAGAPLVTSDGPLVAAARAHGVTVLSPPAAARRLG